MLLLQVSSNSGKQQAKLLSSVIVRKRSKDEPVEPKDLDTKKPKSSDEVVTPTPTTTATEASKSEKTSSSSSATGLGALAGLGDYYSDSDDES